MVLILLLMLFQILCMQARLLVLVLGMLKVGYIIAEHHAMCKAIHFLSYFNMFYRWKPSEVLLSNLFISPESSFISIDVYCFLNINIIVREFVFVSESVTSQTSSQLGLFFQRRNQEDKSIYGNIWWWLSVCYKTQVHNCKILYLE